ncbi:MAG TPA: dihydrolipoamide acetyltransferase family protein [Actinomycetota bacterium]|nr:dihydrolipoamide acetyltransferase family protein [Actinomycetota bacterium]
MPAASPKARRLARERGMDLGALAGSGPGGAVVATDLGAARAEGVPVGAVHRRMAERTAESWRAAPHFYLSRDVLADRAVELVEALRRGGAEVTLTDVFVRAAALALRAHPRVNGRWEDAGPTVVEEADVNVGIAVATDDGLVVPVIRGADRMGLRELAARRRELVERARGGTLRPEDVRGGTFTLSNLGMFGVDRFAAVLNPPQAAILAVGRVADRPVVVGGRVEPRAVVSLTLSCDHRVVDGALGARFLDAVASAVEGPSALIMGGGA